MPTLELGVIDTPYAVEAPRRVRVKVRRGKNILRTPQRSSSPAQGAETTGDVAEYLENKYHIMESFFEVYADKIGELLAESAEAALDNLISGASGNRDIKLCDNAVGEIEALFKFFITTQQVETLGISGVPTKAALMGVNHRLKVKRGPRRPSFVDSGAYVASFKTWLES